MKRSEQDELLAEILSTDEIATLRRASLEQGLGYLRRRARRRRIVRVGLFASVPVVFGFLVLRQAIESPMQHLSPSASTARSQTSTEPSSIKLIGDDELLALFPNRSVALIGKPGHQQLVFLDVRTRNVAR